MSSSHTSPPSLTTKAHAKRVPHDHATPPSSLPIVANFDSSHLLLGAGVAIFHLATARVVLCYHSVDQYWFLPKGRRDASEDSGSGAEREGFEEVSTMPSPTVLEN